MPKFDILSKTTRKPFIISKEFAKEILESKQSKEKSEELEERARQFEQNNLNGQVKIKTRKK